MDRRTFLAILLTAIVIVVTPLLFPSQRRAASDTTKVAADSVSARQVRGDTNAARAAVEPRVAAPKAAVTATRAAASAPADTLVVLTAHAKVGLSTLGAGTVMAELSDYRTLRAGEPKRPVMLEAGTGARLIDYRLNLNGTVVALDTVTFVAKRESTTAEQRVTFRGTAQGHRVSIAYQFTADDSLRYMAHVVVSMENAPSRTTVEVLLPSTLISADRDSLDDTRHLAVAFKPIQDGVENFPFSKVDTGKVEVSPGAKEWVAVRNKYFLVSLLAPGGRITLLTLAGQPRENGIASKLVSIATLGIDHDTVGFDVYAGPQEFQRLRRLGNDLDQVNPYAGWTHSIVQPFATMVTRFLLWMKSSTGLSYGWVIVIFGVIIRVALWPLNQNAMRTSIRMQRLQPELAEVQAKHKNDPEKQRDALVKLYSAHGMTPFSPMMGCLPLLIPMPIVLALYFVFQNTIEFRGVSFLWLPDISAADPYYLTPLFMGGSMFVLSWLGMRGTPPTPQTRMMSYMMPVLLTVMFFRFAAGLNLYYAVQNVAALPQQWLLSKERIQANTAGARKKSEKG